MNQEEINALSEEGFISYILCTICDYARNNGYQVTDTVKTMGESLAALTEIACFDNWGRNSGSTAGNGQEEGGTVEWAD